MQANANQKNRFLVFGALSQQSMGTTADGMTCERNDKKASN